MTPASEAARTTRVGYLVSQYPSVTHTFVLREIQGLRAAGWDVRPVSVRTPDRALDALTPEERAEADATAYVLARGWGGVARENVAHAGRYPLRYLRGLARALRLAGPDARRAVAYLAYWAEAVVAARAFARLDVRHVHAHFSSTVAQLLPDAAPPGRPIGWSATIHGPDEFNDVAGFNLAEKARRSRFLVAISQFAASQIMRATPPDLWDRVDVVPLGVDPSLYAARQPLDGGARVARIVCVARLAPVKGHRVLLKAVAALVRGGRRVQLHLVGGGPDADQLGTAAATLGITDAVVFEGWRSPAEIRSLLAGADVFALASFAEGVPVVLMEAMAIGVPCVATAVNGVPELVRDGVSGRLVPPADPEALAQAIAELLDDPARAAALGAGGRAAVLARYDLRENIRRLGDRFRARLVGP